MKQEKDIQSTIDTFAQKRLSHLQASTFHFEIIGCIEDFRSDLAGRSILTDDIEAQAITHSEKIHMEFDTYLQLDDIIKFIAAYFGTEHRYVTNHRSGNGVIFIGHTNHIYATQIAFDCLSRIATELRNKYELTLKRYKKQETKEARINEYMYEWVEGLTEEIRYYAWHDAADREHFSDYIKKQFKTSEDQHKIMLRVINIIRPLYETEPDPSTTWGEFKKELFNQFPEEVVQQTFKELDDIQAQDIVMVFPTDKFMEEEEEIDYSLSN